MRFDKLDQWQAEHNVKNAALARLTDMAHTTIERAKTGDITLGMDKMLAIQSATNGEITPNDWGAFYALLPPRKKPAGRVEA